MEARLAASNTRSLYDSYSAVYLFIPSSRLRRARSGDWRENDQTGRSTAVVYHWKLSGNVCSARNSAVDSKLASLAAANVACLGFDGRG